MTQRERFLELDSLRGIAALLVVFFHMTMYRPEASYGFKYGCTGVDLFFMISGFVIFLTITKTGNYKDFLWSRFGRLYPTYWVCVTFTAALIILSQIVFRQPVTFPHFYDYFINLTMLQYYFNVKNMDGPYWTLRIELLFYVFVLILFLLKKLNRIEMIGSGVILCCLIKQFVLKTQFPALASMLDQCFPLINHFPLFFAGILFYKIKFNKINLQRLILLGLCFLTQVSLFTYDGLSSAQMPQIQYAAILLIFFAIFFLYCNNRLSLIVSRPLLFIGKISYSLYLTHQFIAFNILIPLLTHSRHFKMNFWMAIIFIVLPVIIGIAAFINRFVEVPSVNYFRRFKRKSQESSAYSIKAETVA